MNSELPALVWYNIVEFLVGGYEDAFLQNSLGDKRTVPWVAMAPVITSSKFCVAMSDG